MDNRVLNINGGGQRQLKLALEFAFSQGRYYGDDDFDVATCEGWRESKKHGLILYNYMPSSSSKTFNKFPCELDNYEIIPIVEKWLKSDFAKTVELSEWCQNMKHDGENDIGWQIYLESWGHVDNDSGVICAVKPAYLWYGK